MCLAVPARVIELLPDEMALIDLNGIQREVSLMVLNGECEVGDYVLIHVGYAIEKIDEEEAARTLELFKEMAVQDQEAGISGDLSELGFDAGNAEQTGTQSASTSPTAASEMNEQRGKTEA